MSAEAKNKKGNWIVRIKCVVLKEAYVENCTEEEARNNPWEHSVDELETCMSDWEVKSVISDV